MYVFFEYVSSSSTKDAFVFELSHAPSDFSFSAPYILTYSS